MPHGGQARRFLHDQNMLVLESNHNALWSDGRVFARRLESRRRWPRSSLGSWRSNSNDLPSFDAPRWVSAGLTGHTNSLAFNEFLGRTPTEQPMAAHDGRQGLSVILPIGGDGIQEITA